MKLTAAEIARLMEGGPGVIATGGGAFVQPETRALILDRGIAVWLDSDVDTLVERVRRKDTRPLLRGWDPKEIVARLKAEREPAYAEAPIHLASAGLSLKSWMMGLPWLPARRSPPNSTFPCDAVR